MRINRIFLILLLLAALIIPASASYLCNLSLVVGYFNGSAPWTLDSGIDSEAAHQALCNTCGYGHTNHDIYWQPHDTNGGHISGAWGGNLNDYSVSNNNTRYVSRIIACTGASYMTLSTGACFTSIGDMTDYDFDTFYRTDTLNECTPGTIPIPDANFTGTPTQGSTPLSVAFTDTSLNATFITSWNWSASGLGGYWFGTPAAEDSLAQFYGVGNYTITHCLANTAASDCESKTDYIWAYNDTSQSTLTVTAINGNSGYPIVGANIDLYDVENTSWTNTTSSADGSGSITTLLGHTVDAYASATGFASNDKTGIPVETRYDSVLLYPSGWTNVSGGNATLYVYTYDSSNHALPIKGAAITIASATTSTGGFTNTAGMAQFTIKNETPYLIDVRATGYDGQTQMTTYTGIGGGSATQTVTFYLSKKTVTPTVTATTGPGGTVPTTADPYDDMTPTQKQSHLVEMILEYGPMLVTLFIMATIIGTMKMMGR